MKKMFSKFRQFLEDSDLWGKIIQRKFTILAYTDFQHGDCTAKETIFIYTKNERFLSLVHGSYLYWQQVFHSRKSAEKVLNELKKNVQVIDGRKVQQMFVDQI